MVSTFIIYQSFEGKKGYRKGLEEDDLTMTEEDHQEGLTS